MEEDFESAEEDFESDTEEDFKQRRRDGFSGDQVWPSRPPPPPPFQSQSETICIWWEYLFPAPDSFLTPSYPRSPPPLLQPSQSPSPLPRSPVLQSSSSSLSSPSSPSPPQLAWSGNGIKRQICLPSARFRRPLGSMAFLKALRSPELSCIIQRDWSPWRLLG
ncbi:formin-like protein 14 isoform X5 [Prosopis cineraria]|uniref:formin-like protein 14 isoform X5 n=1 Tax=Prosopis cineraria TaxID=364024 RepID=UPI00240F85E3|nr:formin-like protein 14 isoform X5 [Prosopis cineraria]